MWQEVKTENRSQNTAEKIRWSNQIAAWEDNGSEGLKRDGWEQTNEQSSSILPGWITRREEFGLSKSSSLVRTRKVKIQM